MSRPQGEKNDRTKGRVAEWSRFTVTGVEADLAYFHARKELIGEPDSTNQKAQISTFKLLEDSLKKVLQRLKRKGRSA